MAFANYRIHRKWPFWVWVADFHGMETRTGFAICRASARWSARCWLRSRRLPLVADAVDEPRPAREVEATPV
jgi:hypothetical protein